jgi:alpha-glucoside transport system permease protein
MKDLLNWVGSLPALAQIPVIVAIFLAAATAIVVLIEVAPRPGKVFTAIRFAACLVIPGIVLLLMGSVWWAIAAAVVLGGLFFLLDYRSRQGAGYLFALFGFLSPAILLLLVGLVYPTIATLWGSLLSNRGAFIGLDNYAWIFSQPDNLVVIRNTIIWVLVVPILSTAIGLAYAVFIDRSRGEKFFKILVFMPMAISFVGASVIWRFVYDYRPGDRDQI